MNQRCVERNIFGRTADDIVVEQYTLRNDRGTVVKIITYGATVTELWAPDCHGRLSDIVLGFDNLQEYERQNTYFGCIVGRTAFRIVKGLFNLDGRTYHLALNNGPNHIHGGPIGFNKVVWRAEPCVDNCIPAVKFTHHSPDGDQGYPGALDVSVVYSLSDENELRIDCSATTDRPTLVNLTHHSYFNLAGDGISDVLGHVLWIDSDRWIRSARPDVSTDEIVSVKNTPYDFRVPTPIGTRIAQAESSHRGYDLCYLHNHPSGTLAHVATLHEPTSGRSMEVHTTEPAIVLYTGNYLDGRLQGKNGTVYRQYAGVCLETGRPPDAVNHPMFPSIILRPEQTYRHVCIYRFTAN